MRVHSNERRIGRGTLQAMACVVLSASAGIAAGAASTRSHSAPEASSWLGPTRSADTARQERARAGTAHDDACAPPAEDSTVLVRGGIYRSFFKRDGKAVEEPVAAFRIDENPVSRGAFADFVRKHPAWRRSRVKRLFADEAYLADFRSDTDAGQDSSLPVTFVSWFAAREYCACQWKRLPSLAEWERAATPDARDGGDLSSRVESGRLAFAMGSSARAPGSPRFGSVWEWTEDFDGAPVSSRTSDAAASDLFCGAGVRAADASDYGGFLRYAFRSSLRAAYALKNLGFRCARDAR